MRASTGAKRQAIIRKGKTTEPLCSSCQLRLRRPYPPVFPNTFVLVRLLLKRRARVSPNQSTRSTRSTLKFSGILALALCRHQQVGAYWVSFRTRPLEALFTRPSA